MGCASGPPLVAFLIVFAVVLSLLLCTFETCRPLPIMSVVRRIPEVVFRGHHDRLTRTRHRAPSPKYFTPSFKGCALFGFELAIFAIDRSAPLCFLHKCHLRQSFATVIV